MGISWWDKIMNVEVLKRAGLPPLKAILIQKNLRCLGHVERMDQNRLPWQQHYSQLKEGRRNQGRPRLRFKDTVKRPGTWGTWTWTEQTGKRILENREGWRWWSDRNDDTQCPYRQTAMMMTTRTTTRTRTRTMMMMVNDVHAMDRQLKV